MSDNRTEKATPKKREDAKKKGQIARRKELPTAVKFLAALFLLQLTGVDFVGRAGDFFKQTFAQISGKDELTIMLVHKMFIEAGGHLAFLSLPVMLAALAGSVVANFAQGGFTLTPNALVPKADKFNPVKNIKKIFSMESVVELVKSVLKLLCVALVSYTVFSVTIKEAPSILNSPAVNTLSVIGELGVKLGLRAGIVLLILAIADYGYGIYKHEKSLKMTKQEVRDEFKQQEGDPLVKGQRRRFGRSLSQRRMMLELPSADVVVTNPTHFAVALRYDKNKDAAPVVVAKGADFLAQKIRSVANEHDIMIIENPPLARTLYKAVDIGKMIPAELFRAVAEILAYVYRKKEEAKGL